MNRLGWVGLVVLASCGARETALEVCAPLPETLHLGTVALGASNRVVLLGVGLQDASATLDGTEFQVSPDGAGLAVSVTPTTRGRRTALLRVEDPLCGVRSSQVSVDAVAPCVDVPASLTFSATERTCGRASATLPVTNRCAEPVRLSATVLEPPDAPGAWCPGGQGCVDFRVTEGPRSVPAQGQASYQLVATPAAVGEVQGTLRVTVAQGDGTAVHEVALAARGLDRPRVTDVLPAPAKAQGDLLLVIDTSAASVPHRASVRENLRRVGTYLTLRASSRVSTRVHLSTAALAPGAAVITLDPEDPGLPAALAAAFDRLPVVDTPSCGQGLLNLSRQVTPRPGVPTAGLCVMFARDEAPGPWMGLVAQLDGPLRVASVIGPFQAVPGCRGPDELDNGRLRTLARSLSLNGVIEDSCSPDWSTSLQDIEKAFFGGCLPYYLTRRALRAPDQVRHRGVVLEAFDVRGARQWEWDAQANALSFDPLYCPEPGSPPVEVVYEPACDDASP